MKPHTKIYFDHFGVEYYPDGSHDFIKCEIPGCQKQARDIHHINPRGMGGNPKGDKDKIENLMALCREHHDQHEGQNKEYLTQIHLNNL